jgi:hypothetical protein
LLLFHVDPSCEDGRFAVPTHVGDCVAALPDDHVLSDIERKHYVVVQTDKPLDECRATFCASGVPDKVAQDERDAEKALLAAATASPLDQQAVDAANAALAAARYSPTDYPWRRVKLDVAQLPPESVQAVVEFKAAVDAARPDGYAAKEAMLAASIEQLGISPSKAAKLLNPDPTKKVDLAGVAADAIVDVIRSDQRAAWDLVVGAVEREFAPLDPVVVDGKTLDGMVIDTSADIVGGGGIGVFGGAVKP